MFGNYNSQSSSRDCDERNDNELVLYSYFLEQVGSLMETTSIGRFSGVVDAISSIFNTTDNVVLFHRSLFIFTTRGEDDILLEPSIKKETTNLMRPYGTR